jgi:hypothetical protein
VTLQGVASGGARLCAWLPRAEESSQ